MSILFDQMKSQTQIQFSKINDEWIATFVFLFNAYTTMGNKVELANVSGRKCNSVEMLFYAIVT